MGYMSLLPRRGGLPDRTFTVPGVIFPALAGDTITNDHNVQFVTGIN